MIIRFFGLYKIEAENTEPYYFVLMENLIPLYPGITVCNL